MPTADSTVQLPALEGLDPLAPLTVLIVTVGGSHQPVVKALEVHQPDYVVFLCSEDQRTPRVPGSWHSVVDEGPTCSARYGEPPSLPNVRVQAGLEAVPHDVVRITAIDDLPACYTVASVTYDAIRCRLLRVRLIADYTGGTKSMSAGLAAAALDDGQGDVSVVSGERTTLVKVEDGLSHLRTMDASGVQVRRQLKRAAALMKVYDYAAIEAIARELGRERLASAEADVVQRLAALSVGFGAWDRFDHALARRTLLPYRAYFIEPLKFLDAVCCARRFMEQPRLALPQGAGSAGSVAALEYGPGLDKEKGSGFEIAEDLLLNAERCAARRRFDDAVGRLYRAAELTMQIHFRRRYDLWTGELVVAGLPPAAREKVTANEQGLAMVSLRAGYDLLAHFDDDPLYAVYAPRRKAIINALTCRNNSLFAHGFRPLGAADYREVERELAGLVRVAIAAVVKGPRQTPPVQFPGDLLGPVLAIRESAKASES